MIESIQTFLQETLGLSPETLAKLLNSAIIILVLWGFYLLILRFIHRRYAGQTGALYNGRKATQYILAIIGIILVGRLWLAGLQTLATYLGLVSAGIAIALQDIIINLAGWLFILWRRPFTVSDRIEIGDNAGDVIDQGLFEFALLEIGKRIDAEQSTGRIIHIPNGKVFTEPFANFSQGIPYIWNEIPVLVTFESDWEKAKNIMIEIANQVAPHVEPDVVAKAQQAGKRYVINYRSVTPTVYTEVASSGVLLTIRYLVNPRQKRSSENDLWEAILRGFALHTDIDFAYETQREFLHFREGKEALFRREDAQKRGRTDSSGFHRRPPDPDDDL